MLVVSIVALVALATMNLPRGPDSLLPGWSVVPPLPPGLTLDTTFVPDINADGWCWSPTTRVDPLTGNRVDARVTAEGARLWAHSDLKIAIALGFIDLDSLMPITKLALGLDAARSYRCKEI